MHRPILKYKTLAQCRFDAGRRRRRWLSIKFTLDQRLGFVGLSLCPLAAPRSAGWSDDHGDLTR